MLQQVLHAFEEAREPLNLAELAGQLGVEPGALEGMIGYWVRKGRLKDASASALCSSGACGSSCHPQGCPFVAKMPRTFTLVVSEKP